MKKQRVDENDVLKEKLTFCIACGEVLADYCFSDQVKDLRRIMKISAQCKKRGRKDGDVCSRFFIAHPDDVV